MRASCGCEFLTPAIVFEEVFFLAGSGHQRRNESSPSARRERMKQEPCAIQTVHGFVSAHCAYVPSFRRMCPSVRERARTATRRRHPGVRERHRRMKRKTTTAACVGGSGLCRGPSRAVVVDFLSRRFRHPVYSDISSSSGQKEDFAAG
ncbi:hypothetical protein HPB50_019276 [Hyalomma asiaticum]|uniref:Uncharacterized protein n=1 Tax=Hyalomma asiaticum TaxID=266040 RepID=A0ACB7RV54_HYAAI|nr:hypothetical protein HPB50_019276 [Hyalomma asiaticum]